MQKNKKGFFITIEGPEGSGKSTQAFLLAQWLEKQKLQVFLTREPGGCAIGKKIRQIILDPAHTALAPLTEAMLYAADRAQHVAEELQPALEEGKVIVCDRYSDSYLAYQGYGRGLPLAEIQYLDHMAAGTVKPDLTFFLMVLPETGFARVTKRQLPFDRMEQQTQAFHQRVYQGYLSIAAANPKRIHLIDGTQSPEKVAADMQQEVAVRLRF